MNGNKTKLNISTMGDLVNVEEVRVGERSTEVDSFSMLSDDGNFLNHEPLAMTEGPISATIRYRGATAKTQYASLKAKQKESAENSTTYDILATDGEGTTHGGQGFVTTVGEIVYIGNQPVKYSLTITPVSSWTTTPAP